MPFTLISPAFQHGAAIPRLHTCEGNDTALAVELPDLGTPTRVTLESAMHGHVLAQAVLMGTYEKIKK